jgi:hypothetical protein
VVRSSTLNEPPRKASSLEMNLIDDQIVVYPVGSGQVYCLNTTAALVFEPCDGTRQVSEIIDLVRHAYNLPESPGEEVMTFLANLQAAGIVR